MRLFCLRFSFDCDGLSFDEDMVVSVRRGRGCLRCADGELDATRSHGRGERAIASLVTFI